MEKVERNTVTTETVIHKFYCDKCGEYIGESEEYDVDYYTEKGKFEVKINFNGWYILKECLCDKCAEKKTNEIYRALKDLGFKYDGRYKVVDMEKVPEIFRDNIFKY